VSKPPKYRILAPWKAFKCKDFRLTIKVLARHQPLTRRQLSSMTNLEISSLCRILFNLTNLHGTTKVAFIAKCNITGRPVNHYVLRNWKGKTYGR